MIPLDSPRWNEIHDAYRAAGHIPGVLRRIADGENAAWWGLYDSFALVNCGEISEAAFASVPHVERLANDVEPVDDGFHHLVFAGRVAYIGLCNCSWMAADVLEPCLRAFAKLNDKAKQLLPHLTERDTFEIAKSILAFEQCLRIYDAVYELAGGVINVRCPADTCGASLSIKPRGDHLVAELSRESEADENAERVESVVDPTTIEFDPGAPWMEADALPRVIALASENGPHTAANHLAGLVGNVACVKCGERFSILDEILDPTDL